MGVVWAMYPPPSCKNNECFAHDWCAKWILYLSADKGEITLVQTTSMIGVDEVDTSKLVLDQDLTITDGGNRMLAVQLEGISRSHLAHHHRLKEQPSAASSARETKEEQEVLPSWPMGRWQVLSATRTRSSLS